MMPQWFLYEERLKRLTLQFHTCTLCRSKAAIAQVLTWERASLSTMGLVSKLGCLHYNSVIIIKNICIALYNSGRFRFVFPYYQPLTWIKFLDKLVSCVSLSHSSSASCISASLAHVLLSPPPRTSVVKHLGFIIAKCRMAKSPFPKT